MSTNVKFADVGRRIRMTRLALGYDEQREFAKKLKIAVQTLSGYERGEYRLSLSTALKMYDVFGIDPLWLFRGNIAKVSPEELRRKIIDLEGLEGEF